MSFRASASQLILAAPVGRDLVVWNAHRIYGPVRLPMLLEGWTQIDSFGMAPKPFEAPLGRWDIQPVLVLQPDDA